MENNSPEMSYLTGRAHSREQGWGAEAAETPVRLASDNPPKFNTDAWFLMRQLQSTEQWAHDGMSLLA